MHTERALNSPVTPHSSTADAASPLSSAESGTDAVAQKALHPDAAEGRAPSTTSSHHEVAREAASAIRAGLKAVDANPVGIFHLSTALAKAVHERAIRGTQRELDTTSLTHQFKPLGNSQNPVTQIKGTFFIQQSSLSGSSAQKAPQTPNEVAKQLTDAQDQIKSLAIKHFQKYPPQGDPPQSDPRSGKILDVFKYIITPAYEPPQPHYRVRNPVPVTTEDKLNNLGPWVLAALDRNIPTLADDLAEAVQLLRDEIAELYAKPDLTEVPLLINKDQLLSSLQAYEAHLASLSERKETTGEAESSRGFDLEASQELVKKIRAKALSIQSDYIPDSKLTKILKGDEPEKAKLSNFLRQVERYYSSTDILAANDYKDTMAAKLQSLSPNSKEGQQVNLAFKLGVENARELLANELNTLMGGSNPYLTPKTEDTFATSQLGKHAAPTGLTSIWLADGAPLDRKEVSAYNQARQEVAQLQFLGQPIPPDLQFQLSELAAKLRETVSSRSVMAHALQDIELMAYDSHVAQYAVISGDAHCFDFARHLAPATCFTRPGVSEPETLVTLRSTFLDFPQSEDILPPEAVQSILSRDMNRVEEELKKSGRLGDPVVFDKMKNALRAILDDAALMIDAHRMQRPEEMQQLCSKYGVPFNPDIDATRAAFVTHLTNLKHDIQDSCFRQVHPKSFEAWKTRVNRMQEYLASSVTADRPPISTATLTGMRNHVFSELKVFFDVVSRISGNPSGDIGVNRFSGVLGLTTLEQIIFKAEESKQSPPLIASDEEIALMKSQRALLQSQACDKLDLSLTMDL